MRNLKIKIAAILIVAAITTDVIAQRGYGRGYGAMNNAGWGYFCNNIPNLTQEQQTKLDALRTAHWKDVQGSRNLLAEKAAHLRTLRTSDNVDMKEVNKTIDEMGAIRSKMQKSREKHIQDVRSMLTDEQRVYFDNFQGNRGQGFGYGRGNGSGRGCGRMGRGNGAGRGSATARAGYGRGYGRGMGPCGKI